MDINKEQYTRLTDWTKEPTFADLSADKEEADSSRQLQLSKILMYRENMEGGKPLDEKIRTKGKSTQRPLVIRKQAEWAYPIMEEPFLSTDDMFQIQPRGMNDKDAAEQNSMLLNWFMSTKIDKTAFVGEMVRTLYDEGTVIVKDGWKLEEEEIEVEVMEPVYGSPEESMAMIQQMLESGEMDEAQAQAMIELGEPVQIGEKAVITKQMRVTANHPTLEVCDNTNIIVDPTCEGDLTRAQFIIHEYETDYSTLKAQEYVSADIENDDGEVIKQFSGIYKNLDQVQYDYDAVPTYDEADPVDKGTFYFKDKPRKKVKAYEYWGFWDIDGSGMVTPIVATWVGEVMIRLERNPYVHQELPFAIARYMPRKKEIWGQPDGELLKENQETIGVYTRAMHDQTITNALGQRLVDETLFNSPSQWQAFQKGNDARYRPMADPDKMIWKAKIEPIDKSTFEMINYQRSDAESIIGQKAFGNGISGDSLGTSVGGIRTAMDATSKRKLGVLRRISNELLTRLARHMLVNAQEFVDEETIIRLTDGEFQTILKQDIQMEFDLRVDINTPEKEQEVSDKIAFLLQTTMQTLPLELSKTLLKKWANTNKMPDVAKDIEEIQPPGPSEAELKMQQIQMATAEMELENARLANEKLKADTAKAYADKDRTDAHTYEAVSRMSDDSGKAEKLRMDAEKMRAEIRLLESKADELDRKEIEEIDGTARRRQVEDQQFKAEVEFAKANKPKDKDK